MATAIKNIEIKRCCADVKILIFFHLFSALEEYTTGDGLIVITIMSV